MSAGCRKPQESWRRRTRSKSSISGHSDANYPKHLFSSKHSPKALLGDTGRSSSFWPTTHYKTNTYKTPQDCNAYSAYRLSTRARPNNQNEPSALQNSVAVTTDVCRKGRNNASASWDITETNHSGTTSSHDPLKQDTTYQEGRSTTLQYHCIAVVKQSEV